MDSQTELGANNTGPDIWVSEKKGPLSERPFGGHGVVTSDQNL